jgi:hypothetical protein
LVHIFAERYRPAAPDGGTTGAPAAGVPLDGVCSGGFGESFFISSKLRPSLIVICTSSSGRNSNFTRTANAQATG